MGILRVAAAVGALVWIAPHLPATLLQNLPELKGEAVSAASHMAASGGQVLASQAVALCSQNPERCAALLSAAAPMIAPALSQEPPHPVHSPTHPPRELVAADVPMPPLRR